MTQSYHEPTGQSARQALGPLFARGADQPVVMLNLLRFREIADYSQTPELAPAEPISGAAAYDLYMEATLPHLRASGGDVAFMGDAGAWFIGPEGEGWDMVLLVRQSSIQSFLGFAQNEPYLTGAIGHRTAALADSRLLPLIER